jgi:hypothetical protein
MNKRIAGLSVLLLAVVGCEGDVADAHVDGL